MILLRNRTAYCLEIQLNTPPNFMTDAISQVRSICSLAADPPRLLSGWWTACRV